MNVKGCEIGLDRLSGASRTKIFGDSRGSLCSELGNIVVGSARRWRLDMVCMVPLPSGDLTIEMGSHARCPRFVASSKADGWWWQVQVRH
jgi:hypothetical protein